MKNKYFNFKRFIAFTLCEVLITIGILGVVAEITIPSLYNGFVKQTTVTKLQKTYTVLFQAIKLSEVDNGDIAQWDFGSGTGQSTLNWFNTYLAPYMKYLKVDVDTSDNKSVNVYLIDGVKVIFYNNTDSTRTHAFIFLNGDKSVTGGKDIFFFFIGKDKSLATNVREVRPYDSGLESRAADRTNWKNDSWGGCNLSATNTSKPYCAGLIMYDNWQIKSDYPYFN